MCLFCDDPDLTADECLRRVRDLVSRDRFGIVSVAGSRCVAQVSYTVGLTEHGAPELLVTGLRVDDAERLLRLWGDYLLDESVILAGETMGCGPGVLEAVHVSRPQDTLLVAHQVYGDGVRALQLAWADPSGRWPWQPGHRARRAGQPLLGERAPHHCDEHDPNRVDVPPHL